MSGSARRRAVVKIGSSSLTNAEGQIAHERIAEIAGAVARWRDRGTDVVLVSSGAIAAGLPAIGLTSRPTDVALAQAAAGIGQGLLIRAYEDAFAVHDATVAQILLTEHDMVRRETYKNASAALGALLRIGAVPVVNENDTTATREIRFGDNDRLAALVAQLVKADQLLLLTDVDALYTGPPDQPGSRRIDVVASEEDLAGVTVGSVGSKAGTGGMITKLEAADLASAAGITTRLAHAGALGDIVDGATPGTVFPPRPGHRSSRALWLRYATRGAGRIVVDDGAARALTATGSSLLAVGVVRTEGVFRDSVPVDIATADGTVIARGLTAFSSRDLAGMIGCTTAQLRAEHGSARARPVVHRDHLVLIPATVGV